MKILHILLAVASWGEAILCAALAATGHGWGWWIGAAAWVVPAVLYTVSARQLTKAA